MSLQSCAKVDLAELSGLFDIRNEILLVFSQTRITIAILPKVAFEQKQHSYKTTTSNGTNSSAWLVEKKLKNITVRQGRRRTRKKVSVQDFRLCNKRANKPYHNA